jgi:hypothetical protein
MEIANNHTQSNTPCALSCADLKKLTTNFIFLEKGKKEQLLSSAFAFYLAPLLLTTHLCF